MQFKYKEVLWKVIIILISIILLGFTSGKAEEKALAFRLQDLKGRQVSLKNLLEKGPVLLDFWASWCKPCVKSLPKLQIIYDKYKADGLTIVGINQDGPRNRSKINPFVKSKRITFPILIDDNSDVMRKYRIFSLPATVIISAEGNIIKVHRGYRSGAEKILEDEIKDLLEK